MDTSQPIKIPRKQDDEHQKQITLKLPRPLLARIDAAAARFNVSRAAYMKSSLSKAVEKDVV
jgi:hypothetical protein